MKHWKAALWFFACFLMQASLINMFAISNTTPNLLLAVTLVFAVLYDEEMYSFIYGTAFGLLYDICFTQYIGTTAIPLFCVALFVRFGTKMIYKQKLVSVVIAGVIATIAYYILNWLLLSIAGTGLSFGLMLRHLPKVMLYTVVVMIIIYIILFSFIRKRKANDKRVYYRTNF